MNSPTLSQDTRQELHAQLATMQRVQKKLLLELDRLRIENELMKALIGTQDNTEETL